jgi:hypothetical protein
VIDLTVTRFQSVNSAAGGFSNVHDTDLFSDIPVGDWTRYHNFVTDFDQYVAADWVNTGAGTAALTAGDGGLLLLTSAVSAFQSLQKTPANYKITAGNPLWGSWIAQLDSLLGTILEGLLNVTVTPFTTASQTDGIYLTSTVTTGALQFNIAVGGVITTVAAGVNIIAGNPFSFRFFWDGACYDQFPNGRVLFELSNLQGQTAGLSGNVRGEIVLPAGTAFPGATLVTPTTAVNASTAVARVITLDQIDVFKTRVNPNSTPLW